MALSSAVCGCGRHRRGLRRLLRDSSHINFVQFQPRLSRSGEDNFLQFQNLLSCSGVVAETRPLRLGRSAKEQRLHRLPQLRISADSQRSRRRYDTAELSASLLY